MQNGHYDVDARDSAMKTSSDQVRSIIERIERLEEEKREVADQIKEVYAEADSNGFDKKALRAVVTLRRKTAEERAELESLVDLYLTALGES